MNRQLWAFDLEVFPNYFCGTFQNLETGEKHYYEVSSRRDDSKDLRIFLEFLSGYLVSFNGIDYDDIILSYWYQEQPSLQELKAFSDSVINRNEEAYKYYKWLRCFPSLKSIDLFRYWSKMLRLSKKISLKSLGIQLGYHTVQELPYHHTTVLTEDQMEEVKYYNYEHDLNILKLLYEALKDKVDLRFQVEEQYKIKCISDDAPKIALKLIEKDLAPHFKKEATWQNFSFDTSYLRDLRTYRTEIKLLDILLDFPFTEQEMSYKIDKGVVVCSNYYTMYELLKQQTIKTTKELAYSVILRNPNELYLRNDHGTGGIHGITSQKVFKEDENTIVATIDLESMYPYFAIEHQMQPQHLAPYFSEYFRAYREKRVVAKREKDQLTNEVFKLVLNSSIGMFNNEYAFLYDPQANVSITLNGQLFIGYCCEKLIEAGYSVVSTNTDGIEVLVQRDKYEEFKSLVQGIADTYKLKWEYKTYRELYYLNINNYIAWCNEDNKPKHKGVFVYNKPLGDSVDELIIPKALEAYFINKVKPEVFIKAHKDIKDFCLSKKISKEYSVFWMNNKVQNLNRFYVSKKGAYLYKKKSRNLEHVLKGYAVQLYNVLTEEFPNDVNYDYYIKKTWEIIWEIEGTNLSLF